MTLVGMIIIINVFNTFLMHHILVNERCGRKSKLVSHSCGVSAAHAYGQFVYATNFTATI